MSVSYTQQQLDLSFDFETESANFTNTQSSTEKWREDLMYLVKELETRHTDLYAYISESEFQKQADRLYEQISNLTDEQIVFELARLTANIQDGHTGIFLPFDQKNDYRRYPIKLQLIKNGWMILVAAPQYQKLIGKKLTEIDGVEVEQLYKTISPIVPRDNIYGQQRLLLDYLLIPEVLKATGLVKNVEELELTLVDQNGKSEIFKIKPVDRSTKINWLFLTSKENLPLWLKRQNEKYWFTYLEDRRTVFLQFNSADIGRGEPEQKFIQFTDELVRFVEENDVHKLIIDLRWNDGGNYNRTRHLWYAVIRSEKINKRGQLFTIIGPETYSAGVMQAVALEQYTNTLFVGEPTGGRPNHSGELRRFRLPHSNIEVRYSAAYHRPSEIHDNRPAIRPDIYTPLKMSDYINGTDPALQAIFDYQPPQGIGNKLRNIINEQDIESTVEAYYNLKQFQRNKFIFKEAQLNKLGYDLLKENRVEEAVAIFELNAKEYAYSANVYDGLGDAYRAAERFEEAIENYEKAFSMDKRYDHTLAIISELKNKIKN